MAGWVDDLQLIYVDLLICNNLDISDEWPFLAGQVSLAPPTTEEMPMLLPFLRHSCV